MGDLHRRLIVFDLDGTLVDSRRDLADSANQLITELGGAPLSEEEIGLMVGEGARVLLARALRAANLGDQLDDNLLSLHLVRFLKIYDGRLLRHTKPYAGIVDALQTARSHAHLAVLTNKPTRATRAVLDGVGLSRFFEDVIGGDGQWPRKPDPAGLHHLMTRANVPSSGTLLVGDSAVDHETATRGGVSCCLATYGFGYLNFPSARLTGSEYIARTPADLTPIFGTFRDA